MTDDVQTTMSLKEMLNEYEKRLILHALETKGYNKTHAAELLMMGRTTLVERMRRVGLVHLIEEPNRKKD